MNIQPVAATGTSGTSSSSSTATDYQTTFMKLLSTELQSQDPTQTVDPTTMVTQMVEINQLSDVAGIYSLLQSLTSSGTTATSGAQTGTHAAAASAAHAATPTAAGSAQASAVGVHGTALPAASSNNGTTGQKVQGGN